MTPKGLVSVATAACLSPTDYDAGFVWRARTEHAAGDALSARLPGLLRYITEARVQPVWLVDEACRQILADCWRTLPATKGA